MRLPYDLRWRKNPPQNSLLSLIAPGDDTSQQNTAEPHVHRNSCHPSRWLRQSTPAPGLAFFVVAPQEQRLANFLTSG